MSNKYFLKKSWVNVDVCVEDYHNSGTTLKDLEKLNWSPYSNIISREVKKSNGLSSKEKTVSVKDCKE